ncbi:MAG TPA: hypothetical protein GX693_02030 [Firmicutes bacterium]|nr:hypothetical protein [Bacillota bacterium]
MEAFLIVTRRSVSYLKQQIEKKRVFLNLVDFNYSWHNADKNIAMLCLFPRRVTSTKEQSRKVGEFLASIIARLIVSHFRDLIFQDLIKDHYFYFKQEEQRQIADLARRSFQRGIYCHQQKTVQIIIEGRLKEYLMSEGQHLNLEGFINFRLQDFQDELKKAVEVAVESYLMEKEYRELVRMLRYLLELEDPKIDLIHLLVDKWGQIWVADQQFIKIDPHKWEDFSMEDLDGYFDFEDLLISMLVSIAPRQVLVHQNVLPRYPRLVETIKMIFDQRAVFCPSCERCSQEPLYLVTRGDT